MDGWMDGMLLREGLNSRAEKERKRHKKELEEISRASETGDRRQERDLREGSELTNKIAPGSKILGGEFWAKRGSVVVDVVLFYIISAHHNNDNDGKKSLRSKSDLLFCLVNRSNVNRVKYTYISNMMYSISYLSLVRSVNAQLGCLCIQFKRDFDSRTTVSRVRY